MSLNQKRLGYILLGISFLLIVILVLVKIQDDKQGAFLCELVAKDPSLTMADCPAHERTSSWLILAAFGFALLILVSGIYLLLPQLSSQVSKSASASGLRKESKSEKVSSEFENTASNTKDIHVVDISRLGDDEKKIYNLLKSRDGSMYQSDIMRETQMSKVKVTRVLDKLEGRHIIERKRRGMTNIVILK